MSSLRSRCRAFALLIAAFAVAGPAYTQTPDDESPAVRRLMTGLPLTYLHAIGRDLAREAKFDDVRLEALAAVVDANQAAITEDRRNARRLRLLMPELASAQEANDQPRVADITREIESIQQVREAFRAQGDPFTNFFNDVRTLGGATYAEKIDNFERRLIENRFYGNRIRTTLDAIPADLALDAEQRATFESLRESLRDIAPKPSWNAAIVQSKSEGIDMGPLRSTQPEEAQALTALRSFFASLSATLNDTQIEQLRGIQETITENIHETPVDARLLFRAVKRLRLDPEQSAKIRELEKGTMIALRAAKRDEAAEATISSETRAKIDGVLNPQQRERFTLTIEKLRGH